MTLPDRVEHGAELAVECRDGRLQLAGIARLGAMLQRERERVQTAGTEQRRAAFDRVREVAQRFTVARADRGGRQVEPAAVLIDEVPDELLHQRGVERPAVLAHRFEITEIDGPRM